MTEYDLETKKALRRVSLLEYGFGPETLRGRKICPACGRGNGAYRTDCISCGAALLPDKPYRHTLHSDVWKKEPLYCRVC